MAKKSKKEEVMKEVSSVDKKIAKLKAVIKKLENSKQIMAINHNKPQDQIPPITPPQPDNITGNLASDNNFAALLIASAPPACLSNLTIVGSSISTVCVQ